jgi:hypothetical protein
MQRRVTAVELRPINLLTASQVAAATDDNEELDPGPDTVVGLNAPNQYKRVVGGFYYSTNITGTTNPRAEIYFSSDTGVQDGKTIRVSGVHKILNSSNVAVDLDVSGDFKVVAIDSPPWENRASYGGNRQTPGEDVDSTVLFNPEVVRGFGAARELIVKSRISTVEATTTTAKIVFTSDNHFKVNDVVFVDLPTDTPFFGLDGLYRVKTAGSNFIEFDFSSALDEPIDSASVTEERYVHATAQALIRDGATWISPDNVVYVWNDIRWVLFKSDVAKDSKAPGPVTDLDATDEVDTISGSTTPTSRVTLTWTAPTKNADNSPLDDLVGYTIWFREVRSPSVEWEKPGDITGAETTTAISGLLQGKTYSFRVFARDSGGNLSTGVTKNHFVGVSLPTVQKPATPTVTTYLGTIKIAYDDLTASGLVQPATAKEIEVYFSDVPGFTAGTDSFYGKFPANAGSYIIIPGTELVDNTDYYIRIIVRDVFGNITEASDPPIAIRAKLSNIVTYDMIDVGTLTGQVIIGADIRTSSQPFNNGGVILNQDGLVAYDDDGQQTFRIDATTGQVSIGDYLSATEAAGLYLTDFDAERSFATIATADGIRVIAGSAEQLAAAANSKADAADLKVSAVTEIQPGTVTVRLRRAATIRAINSARPNPSETQINGSIIETGTLFAEQIGSGEFPVGVVYAGTINAGQVNAGVLEGRTVRTAASPNKRVVLSNSQNAIQFFNSNNTLVGQIDGQTSAGGLLEISGPGTPGLTIGAGSSSFSGGLNVGGNVTTTAGRIGQVVFTAAGGTTAAVHRSSGGSNVFLFGPASSDERLKKDIVELENSLDLINNLRPVKFRFKSEEDGPVSYGLIAQEVKPLFDDNDNVVNSYSAGENDEDKEEYFSIEYNAFIAPLIGAIKELTQKNLALEARIASLEESSE